MGFLKKILKNKAVRSLATDAALNYAKRQSADVRRAAPIIEVALQLNRAVKDTDVLKNTIYSNQAGETMNPEPVVLPQVAPVKEGKNTSSFKLTGLAVILIPLVPIIMQWLEQYVGTLPANSTIAVIGGIVLTVVQYLYTRYKTTTGEREATAKVAEAQVAAVIAGVTVQNAVPSAVVPQSVKLNDDAEDEGTE